MAEPQQRLWEWSQGNGRGTGQGWVPAAGLGGGGTGVSPVVSMCVTHAPAEDPGWLMCRSMLSPKRPAWPWWCQGMCCSAEPHPICTAPVGIGETELGFSEGLIHSCSCLLLGSSICPCSQAPPSSTGWAERHKTSTVP